MLEIENIKNENEIINIDNVPTTVRTGANTKAMTEIEDNLNNSSLNIIAKLQTLARKTNYTCNLAKLAFDTKSLVTKAHYETEQIKAKMQHDKIVTEQKLQESKQLQELIPLQEETKIIQRQKEQRESMDQQSNLYKRSGQFLCLASLFTTIVGLTRVKQLNDLLTLNIYDLTLIIVFSAVQLALYRMSSKETFLLRNHKSDYINAYWLKWSFIGCSIWGTYEFLRQGNVNVIVCLVVAVALDTLAYKLVNMGNNIYYLNDTNKSDVTFDKSKFKEFYNNIKKAKVEPVAVDPVIIEPVIDTREIIKVNKPVETSSKKKDLELTYNKVLEKLNDLDCNTPINNKSLNMRLSDYQFKQIKAMLRQDDLTEIRANRTYKKQ